METKKEAGVRHLSDNYSEHMPEIVETKENGRVKQVAVKRTRGKKKGKEKAVKPPTRGTTARKARPPAAAGN